MGDGTSFQDIETKALTAQMGNLLEQCKIVAKSTKVGRPSRHLALPEFDISPPARDAADKMASTYFQAFESTHRILHIPSFWAEYHRFWEHPESATIVLRLKVLLVIAIGSSLCEPEDADYSFRDTVHRWIYAAQTWLSGPLEKDRLNISGLQVHCLTILARQVFSIGADLVWMSTGSLVNRAMQIGLHRDPKYLPGMSSLQAELRRRIWATILEIVVQASLDSAMPPRISAEEFDTEAPSNNNDDELDESTAGLQPHPKDTYTLSSIQLVLLESLPTRLRILQLLNGLRSELSYMDVLSLSTKITEACRECSEFTRNNESSVTPFHRNLLDCLVRRFMIPLHYPFASKARTNPLFEYSLKTSIDTAMSIISPEPDERFSRLMSIGGGLFREGFRYASAILTCELLAQVEAQRLDGTPRRNSQYRELLKQALRDMISMSTQRIRQGETNIKGHVFMSMVLAQAEAIEADVACEFPMAQSGKESLEFCLDLLQMRASAAAMSYPGGAVLSAPSLDGGREGSELDLGLDFFFPDADFF